VAFSEWTHTGTIRQPSYKGLRHDKDPREVVREVPSPIRDRTRDRFHPIAWCRAGLGSPA
jgi:ATP-dependent DNA ligase